MVVVVGANKDVEAESRNEGTENALSGTAMLKVRIMLCRVLIIVVGVPQLLGSRWIQKMGRYIIVPGHPKP